jgi:hypothetical protein
VALLAFHLLVTRRIKIDEGRKALIAAVNLPFPAEQEVVRKPCRRIASQTGPETGPTGSIPTGRRRGM